ncbi:MAG: branched-chain amino acid ABC transporter permease [Acidimicrobiales bacterium]
MRGRPLLHTSYQSDSAMLNTTSKRVGAAVLLALVVLLPFGRVPGLGLFGDAGWQLVLVQVLIFAIAALGLNVLTGLAGQVSLGHAFFMGVGAYAGLVLGAEPRPGLWGLGLPIWIWVPGAGVVAALLGILVSPAAVRLRGLYLAIVTLGLVFVGEHLFRNLEFIAGTPGLGRSWPDLELKLWKEEEPLLDLAVGGDELGVRLTGLQKQFVFILLLLLVFMLITKNIARTRTGRALQAIRDRDIAAEIMGVPEAKYKLIAFAISSFYAGVGGALLGSVIGSLNPEFWSLVLSVQLIAIILIGGIGTVSGTLLGSVFVVASARLIEEATGLLETTAQGDGLFAGLADLIVVRGQDFGLISLQPTGPGLALFHFNQVFYGLLVVLFLIFEPLGLYGIWIKVRNYWKGWPFSY